MTSFLHTTGDFEVDVGTWISTSGNIDLSRGTDQFHGGVAAAKLVRANSAGALQVFSGAGTTTPKTPVSPGQVMTTRGWLRHNAAAGNRAWFTRHRYYLGNVLVDEEDHVGTPLAVAANTWTLMEFTSTAPSGVDGSTMLLATTGATGSFQIGEAAWVDDVVAFTDVDLSGTIQLDLPSLAPSALRLPQGRGAISSRRVVHFPGWR